MNGTSRRRLVSWLLIGLGITLMLLMWSEQQLRLQPHSRPGAQHLAAVGRRRPLRTRLASGGCWRVVRTRPTRRSGGLHGHRRGVDHGLQRQPRHEPHEPSASLCIAGGLSAAILVCARGGRSLPGLAFCRAAAQMTQAELARHSGVARERVLRIERLQRRTSPSTINSLAAALATAPERLHGVSSRATNPDPIATSSILRSRRIFLECTGPVS